MGEAKAKQDLRDAASKAHYDLEQAETAIRSHLAASHAALSQECEDDDQRAFLAASKHFDGSRIQFTIGGMRSVNEGVSRDDMLIAGGRALGMMLADTMGVAIGNRERMLVDRSMQQAFAEGVARNNAATAEAPAESVEVRPMQAGQA